MSAEGIVLPTDEWELGKRRLANAVVDREVWAVMCLDTDRHIPACSLVQPVPRNHPVEPQLIFPRRPDQTETSYATCYNTLQEAKAEAVNLTAIHNRPHVVVWAIAVYAPGFPESLK